MDTSLKASSEARRMNKADSYLQGKVRSGFSELISKLIYDCFRGLLLQVGIEESAMSTSSQFCGV